MTAPRVARGPRPVLAPIWMAALAALLLAVVGVLGMRGVLGRLAQPTTIILLRHAEKAPEPAADPPLSVAGQERARRLAALLADEAGAGRVVAIYASDTRRARETAAPLAARLSLDVSVRPGREARALAREILKSHAGQTAVVIGHSNTVPQLLAELTDGGVRASLGEGDFGSIFVVTVSRAGPPAVLRLHY